MWCEILLVWSSLVLHLLFITGLSSIRMSVSRRTRDLVTFLIPELSKLAEAMKLRVSGCAWYRCSKDVTTALHCALVTS